MTAGIVNARFAPDLGRWAEHSRMNRSTLTASMLLLLSLCGCATVEEQMARRARVLGRLETGLRLVATAENPVATIGRPIDVTLALSNVSTDEPITACIGGGRTYLLLAGPNEENEFVSREGRPPAVERFPEVIRPYGAVPVTLPPGGHRSWQEAILVEDVGAGDALLWIGVQLLDPAFCEPTCKWEPRGRRARVRCSYVMVPAATTPIRDHAVKLTLRRQR